MDEYKYPLLLSYNDKGIEIHNRLYPKSIKSVMWIFVDDDAADFIAIRKEARAFATAHKNKVLTMIATSSNDASTIMKHFGLKSSDMPVAMLTTLNTQKHKQDQFIVPNHNVGADGLTDFVKQVQSGTGAKQHVRSEAPKPSDMHGNAATFDLLVIKSFIPHPPSRWLLTNQFSVTPGIVKKVVAKTFEDVVINNKEDVAVFFTMRGCPNCNVAFEAFQKVASSLQSIKSFKFTVFDFNLNELDHPIVNRLKMNDFPAIVMFPYQNNPQDKKKHAVLFNPSSRRSEYHKSPLAMKILMWGQEHANMYFEMPNEAIMTCAKPPEPKEAPGGEAAPSAEL